MRIAAVCLVLFLGACATVTKPAHMDVKFRFVCTPDNSLLVGAFINDDEEPYAAVIGRCVGDLKIIGTSGPQTPTKLMKVS